MSTLVRNLLLLCAAVASFAITYYFVARSSQPSVSGAFGVDPDTSLGTGIMAFVAFTTTLLGVLLGALYRRLVQMQEDGRKTAKLSSVARSVLRSIDFQIGLVGAPVIFGLLWQAISGLSVEAMLVIALQNGFASHAVLKEVTPFQSD